MKNVFFVSYFTLFQVNYAEQHFSVASLAGWKARRDPGVAKPLDSNGLYNLTEGAEAVTDHSVLVTKERKS